MNGIVNIDKPEGISSRRAVDRAAESFKEKKAGHGGTLDPAASGVLIILLGEATKLSRFFLNRNKTYRACIKLGYLSDTLDSDGKIVKSGETEFSKEKIRETVESFRGPYRHYAPEYSAKKHKGESFYKIKRSGRTPPERVLNTVIYSIELEDFKEGVITVTVNCSSGTYIRSLANDIAKRLGTNGYLLSLRRTAVADFTIEESAPVSEPGKGFLSIEKAAEKFSYVRITETAAAKVENGAAFKETDIIETRGDIDNNIFSVFSEKFRLKAIAAKTADGFRLERVFKL